MGKSADGRLPRHERPQPLAFNHAPAKPIVRPALVIGVTGGIGSGKSTVANMFSTLGVPVIDADELARQAVMSGQPALREIVEYLGPSILASSGELDRSALRERAFSDPAVRTKLEAIVHPRVYAEIDNQLRALDAPYAIVVVPLLIESGGLDLVDRVLVVDTPRDLQIERASRRDETSRDAIEKIIAVQLDRNARLAAADDVIENSATEKKLEQAVAELHRKYVAEAMHIARERSGMKE